MVSCILVDSLSHFPVVLLVGAIQVGKSKLAQSLGSKNRQVCYLTLDDRTVLDDALTNPDSLLIEVGSLAILVEVQRAPDLLRAVKLVVDRDRKPGTFLLATLFGFR